MCGFKLHVHTYDYDLTCSYIAASHILYYIQLDYHVSYLVKIFMFLMIQMCIKHVKWIHVIKINASEALEWALHPIRYAYLQDTTAR